MLSAVLVANFSAKQNVRNPHEFSIYFDSRVIYLAARRALG